MTLSEIMKTVRAKFSEIIKAALTKFSSINWVQYGAMITLILTMWSDNGLLTPAMVMLISGLLTLFLKFAQSTKELVSTGIQGNWTVYLMGLLSVAMGIIDTWVPNAEIINMISFGYPRIFLMTYLALTVFLRTGFTNQSNNSIAARKSS